MESLVLKYRFVLEELRFASRRPIECLHMIGGGVKNRMLCRFTAEATRLPVFAGPAEATAIGNAMIQAFAAGVVEKPAELRSVVERSFRPEIFRPQNPDIWEKEYERFCRLLE